MNKNLLEIRDLQVQFDIRQGVATVVDKLNIVLNKGETLGIVGESGCGKSITALSIMRLIESPPGRISKGEILLNGSNLLQKSPQEMRYVRGNQVAMIFQEPMTSLNPLFTVGQQIVEAYRIHENITTKKAMVRAIKMLKDVDIPAPEKRVHEYPHQLSGGMRQRVMIAMALALNPQVLIADEPTTALDVTVQAQIFDLLKNVQARTETAIIFITHDMGSIAEMADRVLVMYAGRKMEEGPVNRILSSPYHPYAQGLIACVPHLGKNPLQQRRFLPEIPGVVPSLIVRGEGCVFASRCPKAEQRCREQVPPFEVDEHNHGVACWLKGANRMIDLEKDWGATIIMREKQQANTPQPCESVVEVKNMHIHFPRRKKFIFGPPSWVKAVDDVSFTIGRGKAFGLVGESGSGKTTTALGVMQLLDITSGQVYLCGEEISKMRGEKLRRARRRMQIVFQDPYSSLNPYMRADAIVRDPMNLLNSVEKSKRDERVVELFECVGLRPEQRQNFPHQFSGGQRQRIGVARALASQPDLVVCDEPVSALDVAIQAQILNMLSRLQEELNLTYLFISHDMGVVQHICDEIAVMYLGKIVEQTDRISLFTKPQHPYTLALLSAVPSAHAHDNFLKGRIKLVGDPPSPIDPPPGCRFAARCPRMEDSLCTSQTPELHEIAPGHMVACHLI